MVAEEFPYTQSNPSISDQEGRSINFIFECLKNACIPFKKASGQRNLALPLNENKYTQIFVEQVEVFLKSHPNIGIKNQYSDTFHGTKGIPDFYFHKVEEGVHHEPIFIGEAKILPSPGGKVREREYVIGHSNNGGIERFKTEKHGIGLNNCGLLSFIEKEASNHWLTTINNWILDLASTNESWALDETLSELESKNDYCFLESIVHRKTSVVKLVHLWINLN